MARAGERRPFALAIVDEAAQAVEAETLLALGRLHGSRGRLVLVGDPSQLPATVASRLAEDGGYGTSLLARLMASPRPAWPAAHTLAVQYRMDPEIAAFPAARFYGGKLENAKNGLGDAALVAACLAAVLDEPLRAPLLFLDVASGTERRAAGPTGSVANAAEARLAARAARAAARAAPGAAVVVLTFYAAQAARLARLLVGSRATASTVDAFQGAEADVVVLSFVRCGGRAGFLADFRRLNVALTRARALLVCFGHARTLEAADSDLRALVRDLRRRGLVLPETALKRDTTGS